MPQSPCEAKPKIRISFSYTRIVFETVIARADKSLVFDSVVRVLDVAKNGCERLALPLKKRAHRSHHSVDLETFSSHRRHHRSLPKN